MPFTLVLRRRSVRTSPALRYPRRRPSRSESTLREILSQALAPLQSFTNAPPCAARSPTHVDDSHHTPLPRFCPLQRFASHEEPPTPRELPPHGLSCAPGVSHPFDALLPSRPAGPISSRFRSWGFPSRPCSPRNAVRPFERRDPHAIGYDANAASPPQGFARPEDPARHAWGLAKHRAGCPLGILPLRGFLPSPPDALQ